jgi:hypothetical protein
MASFSTDANQRQRPRWFKVEKGVTVDQRKDTLTDDSSFHLCFDDESIWSYNYCWS